MMIDTEKLLTYYKLKNLVRFNMNFRIKDETVAEHSYFVILFTKMICDELGLDSQETLRCIEYAILHDMPETALGDLPHPVKAANPIIDDTVKQLEFVFMEDNFPNDAGMFRSITDADEGVNRKHWLIVRLADIVSVLQYTALEVKLSNTTMYEIFNNAYARYCETLEELKTEFDVEITCFEEE